MRIIKGFPPNYAEIRAVFHPDPNSVFFCYGDTIYNPSGRPLSAELQAHEQVHSCQQAVITPVKWWDRYLVDIPFRAEQELAAHVKEYHTFCLRYDGAHGRERMLKAIAQRMSGPLYGHVMSYAEAKRLISA